MTVKPKEWRCPRCMHVNDARFCWFCSWDTERPGQEPLLYEPRKGSTA